MGRRRYLLDEDPEKEIMFRWNSGWQSTEVFWNQKQIATLNKEQILAGEIIKLPNKKNLELQLKRNIFPYLSSKIDGENIPGSQGDPLYLVRHIFLLMLIAGIINIIVGFALYNQYKSDNLLKLGLFNFSLGILEILFGFGILKKNYTSMIIGTILMAADFIFAAIETQQDIYFDFIKVLFLMLTLRGFGAFKELRQQEHSL